MESMSGWTPSLQNPAQLERSLNNIISTKYIMNKSYLEQLSKSELIELLLRKNKPTPAPRTKKMVERPIPTPRKSVKQMVQEYEDNIIPPPLEFRDDYKPTPAPRTKQRDWTQHPIPAPRTKFTETTKALSGYTKSCEVSIKNDEDPLTQLQGTRLAIEYNLKKILHEMTGLKFVETLKITSEKQGGDKMIEKK